MVRVGGLGGVPVIRVQTEPEPVISTSSILIGEFPLPPYIYS